VLQPLRAATSLLSRTTHLPLLRLSPVVVRRITRTRARITLTASVHRADGCGAALQLDQRIRGIAIAHYCDRRGAAVRTMRRIMQTTADHRTRRMRASVRPSSCTAPPRAAHHSEQRGAQRGRQSRSRKIASRNATRSITYVCRRKSEWVRCVVGPGQTSLGTGSGGSSVRVRRFIRVGLALRLSESGDCSIRVRRLIPPGQVLGPSRSRGPAERVWRSVRVRQTIRIPMSDAPTVRARGPVRPDRACARCESVARSALVRRNDS
jgi:hypothetical protein